MSQPVSQQEKRPNYNLLIGYITTLVLVIGAIIKMNPNGHIDGHIDDHTDIEKTQSSMQQSLKDLKQNVLYIRSRVDKIK